MSFRVAFDLDGTIADMQAVLTSEAERLFGSPQTPTPAVDEATTTDSSEAEAAPPPADRELTSRQHAELWDHVDRDRGLLARAAGNRTGHRRAHRRNSGGKAVGRHLLHDAPAGGGRLRYRTRHSSGSSGTAFRSRACSSSIARAARLPKRSISTRSSTIVRRTASMSRSTRRRPPILIWPRGDEDGPPGAARVGVRLVRTRLAKRSISSSNSTTRRTDAASCDR